MRAYHIALRGVHVVSQTLQSDPLDGQFGHGALTVIIATVDLLREAEVCHTHSHVLVQPETHTQSSLRPAQRPLHSVLPFIFKVSLPCTRAECDTHDRTPATADSVFG